ncbi:FUSC family protein [Conexibacter woesei]|uniref:FUSC family protein n=1 Tax=Conexibacter woesei TaxID=191495 RepID=UPI00041A6FD0|nr:FUSC family protein [Conexibacter woesei]
MLLSVNVSAGMLCALGALPAAMLGVPPQRRGVRRLPVVGAAFALAYILGSILGQVPALAVAALAAAAVGAIRAADVRPAARILPALVVPAFALGMNETLPDSLGLAAAFLAGSVWAALVAAAWPRRQPVRAATTATTAPPVPDKMYAYRFAAAGAIGLALGYVLDLEHVAWAAAAALFIMRPDPEAARTRALGRAVATTCGVVAAGLILHRGPAEIALAFVVVAAIAAMIGTRASRWYVTSAGSGLVVLLASGAASADAFHTAFGERLLETLIGAALAVLLSRSARPSRPGRPRSS